MKDNRTRQKLWRERREDESRAFREAVRLIDHGATGEVVVGYIRAVRNALDSGRTLRNKPSPHPPLRNGDSPPTATELTSYKQPSASLRNELVSPTPPSVQESLVLFSNSVRPLSVEEYFARAVVVWEARWGPGSAPRERIRNLVVPLLRTADPVAVMASYEAWVPTVPTQYAHLHLWRDHWTDYGNGRAFDNPDPRAMAMREEAERYYRDNPTAYDAALARIVKKPEPK